MKSHDPTGGQSNRNRKRLTSSCHLSHDVALGPPPPPPPQTRCEDCCSSRAWNLPLLIVFALLHTTYICKFHRSSAFAGSLRIRERCYEGLCMHLLELTTCSFASLLFAPYVHGKRFPRGGHNISGMQWQRCIFNFLINYLCSSRWTNRLRILRY